ncbi:hypothetical protein Bca52824_056040 [Brassica carinata]|uniref:Uncharacterized protein n=1 Tax=Brassica carinata TaxID=52824 RepID=A0A8X7ULZ6_BRACI|nr:hypothetical protein Bca52824_056040 [Brassica carinata]
MQILFNFVERHHYNRCPSSEEWRVNIVNYARASRTCSFIRSIQMACIRGVNEESILQDLPTIYTEIQRHLSLLSDGCSADNQVMLSDGLADEQLAAECEPNVSQPT